MCTQKDISNVGPIKLICCGPIVKNVNKMLLELKHLLTVPICSLINWAVSSGKFHPIFENDDPASVSNYRPTEYLLDTASPKY